MKNIDSHSHVRGESIYLDDIALVQGTLFAVVMVSSLTVLPFRNAEVSFR